MVEPAVRQNDNEARQGIGRATFPMKPIYTGETKEPGMPKKRREPLEEAALAFNTALTKSGATIPER